MFYGRLAIEDILKLLLYHEMQSHKVPSVSIFLPMEQEMFSGFFSILNQYSNLHIAQLLYMIKNPAVFENIGFHNLKVLSHVLPLLLTTTANYHIYYTYNDFAPVPETTTGFPYYILFSDFVVLLSPDLDNAWLEDSPPLVSFLQKRFDLLTKQSQKLSVQFKNAVSYLEKSISLYANTYFNYSLEYQPCLMPFMSRELLNSLVNPNLPGKEYIIELVSDSARQFHSLEKNIILFAEKGLDEFAENGVILNIPAEYGRPCTPEERAFLLRRIEEACESDKIAVRCINPTNLSIEKQLYLSLQKSKEVSFFSYNADKDEFRFTGICENTIYAAFSDFVEYMLNSDLVYSREETLEIIRKRLELLG